MSATKCFLPMVVLALAPLPAGAQTVAADPLAPTGAWSANTLGQAQTPPMGWNSWNTFGADVSEDKLLGSAQILVTSGLAARGYRYVNIDDGWMAGRREADGRIQVRVEAFPSARPTKGQDTNLRPLTDRLHAMGLKAGIYSDMGRNTCNQIYGTPGDGTMPRGTLAEREVGLYGHIAQDIGLFFGPWGFDMIKVDACGLRGTGPDSDAVKQGIYRQLGPVIDFASLPRTDIAEVRRLFGQVRQALATTRPKGDFVYSLCLWGSADVRAWGKDIGNTSRTSDDIAPTWTRMLHNLDTVSRRALYAHPGSWNDPDMLEVGMGEFDATHPVEARSHLAMWAMVSAPLLIGLDLRKATPEQLALLGNEALIALDQDKAGNQATLAYDSQDVQIFVKTLSDGQKAVALFNRTAAPQTVTLTAAHLKLAGEVSLAGLLDASALHFTGETRLTLAPHETQLYRAQGPRRLPDGFYLSEMPGRINPAVDGVVVPAPDPTIHRGISQWENTRGDGEHPRYGGWGGAGVDTTPYAQALRMGGKTFDTGIGVLANSRLEVRAGDFARFSAKVGIDDSAWGNSGEVTFAVFGDGKLLARSAPQKRGQAPKTLTADIRGVRLIELVARGQVATASPDPVDWAEAALTR